MSGVREGFASQCLLSGHLAESKIALGGSCDAGQGSPQAAVGDQRAQQDGGVSIDQSSALARGLELGRFCFPPPKNN